MKANELMRGDWVRNDLGEIQRIEEIREEDVMLSYNDYYSYDEIEPIPLSAEILEKNGFTRFGTDYILKERHFGLENPSTPNNYLDNYWLRVSIKAVHIEYVHQLQQVLRLCGIEKEIIL